MMYPLSTEMMRATARYAPDGTPVDAHRERLRRFRREIAEEARAERRSRRAARRASMAKQLAWLFQPLRWTRALRF